MPRKRKRRGAQAPQPPTAPAAPPPVPAGDVAQDLLPFEREVFDRAVARLVLNGCPPEFASLLAWNGGGWQEMATMILDAAVVDVNPQTRHVRLVPRPAT
jgi:hypothetical protein